MKKRHLFSMVLVLQLIFSTMAFAEEATPVTESDDISITITVSKELVKTLCWLAAEVVLVGGTIMASIEVMAMPSLKWEKRLRVITRFGLAGSIALPIVYFYLRSKNSTWVSSVSPEDLKEQFLDIKEKQVAWDQDTLNPYLEIDYLVERKFYHEQVIDYALSYNFEGREALLSKVEQSLVKDSDRLTELQDTLSLLSDSGRLAHLQTTIDIENNTDADLLRTELTQKYEEAIQTLEAAL